MKKKNKNSRSTSKTVKCLLHVIIGVWQFRSKEVIRDNTLFLWNASKLQNVLLAKLSETTHACKVLHKLKQEKKHLTFCCKKFKTKSFLCYDHFLDSTVPWLPKWWSWGRSSCCGGHGWTVALALIFAHSAIISSSQLVPLSFRWATGCALILIQPTKIAQQLEVSIDFKSTAGCQLRTLAWQV